MARYVTASFSKLPDTIDTRYYHTDPIGSVRAITDETGAVVIRHDYRPFGEDVQPLTGDPMRFAGKELDEETGLQYFDARYYRNTWGRFTTVDPIIVAAAMTDPQQWNRYAYARNNPLKWVDPTGLTVTFTSKTDACLWGGEFPTCNTLSRVFVNIGEKGIPRRTLPRQKDKIRTTALGVAAAKRLEQQPTTSETKDDDPGTSTDPGGVTGEPPEQEQMSETLSGVKRRIAGRMSCSQLFNGGTATAAQIIDSTRYQFLNVGPHAWIADDYVVYVNRKGPFLSPFGGRVMSSDRRWLAPGPLREFMVTHETLHQASRTNRLAPSVSFLPDSREGDPYYPENQIRNNDLVLAHCF